MAIGDAFAQILTSDSVRQPASGDGDRMTLYYAESFSSGNMGGMYDGTDHEQFDGRGSGNNHSLGRLCMVSSMILTNTLYWKKGGDGSADQVISGVQIDD